MHFIFVSRPNQNRISDSMFRQRRRRFLLQFPTLFFFIFFLTLRFQASFFDDSLSTTSSPPPLSFIFPPIKSHIDSIYYLYIDIGCFNGETIEHFLHFTPNSSIYNIITFEPDEHNFQLCRSTFTQEKYSNLNIFFLQKAVWIRDEKIVFRTNQNSKSRIAPEKSRGEMIDAIDFSSWLAELIRGKKTKIDVKISVPGFEVVVLEKMINDETLSLISQYQIEWTDRDLVQIRGRRIYIQLLFDSLGYDTLYYTRLEDVREIFAQNQSFKKVKKYYDWRSMNGSDIFAHYVERPDRK